MLCAASIDNDGNLHLAGLYHSRSWAMAAARCFCRDNSIATRFTPWEVSDHGALCLADANDLARLHVKAAQQPA